MSKQPGLIALFGSGEASPDGRRVHDLLMSKIGAPVRACVLETPAGFEPNSAAVAGKLARFLEVQLQNYQPSVSVIPARRRTEESEPDSTDNAATLEPLLHSNYLMMGPGSPTYAVRHLTNSLAWSYTIARHRLGCPLVFASAVAIAVGRYAIPVYEIYKVGEDLHWKSGLDLLQPFGVSAVFVPHWNNNDGGSELDTSRCFMGRPRFDKLLGMLPDECTVFGIDEKTALVLDLAQRTGQVVGKGVVTIIHHGTTQVYGPRDSIDLTALGDLRVPESNEGLTEQVWAAATNAEAEVESNHTADAEPPAEVIRLVEARVAARAARQFGESDRLRLLIEESGWKVNDTVDGSTLAPLQQNRHQQ